MPAREKNKILSDLREQALQTTALLGLMLLASAAETLMIFLAIKKELSFVIPAICMVGVIFTAIVFSRSATLLLRLKRELSEAN